MRVLVASDQHYLLPFAWRLKREGVDVEVLVFKDKFEAAWEGMFDKALTGRDKKKENLELVATLAKEGEMIVVTDSARGVKAFPEGVVYPKLPSTSGPRGPLAIGSWFDGRDFNHSLDHLVVNDWGTWPGGVGPLALGGVTLARESTILHPEMDKLVDLLRAKGFRGLVSAQALVTDVGWTLGVVDFGWPFIHSDAFISDLSSLGDLLFGNHATLDAKYVVTIPVTIPPWPIPAKEVKAREVVVNGLGAEDTKNIFFRDFKRGEEFEIQTVGLDGFICVVRGSADTLELARARAIGVASKIQVPEKQYRPDVGLRAGVMLGGLLESSFFNPVELSPLASIDLNPVLGEEVVNDPVQNMSTSGNGPGSLTELATGDPITTLSEV